MARSGEGHTRQAVQNFNLGGDVTANVSDDSAQSTGAIYGGIITGIFEAINAQILEAGSKPITNTKDFTIGKIAKKLGRSKQFTASLLARLQRERAQEQTMFSLMQRRAQPQVHAPSSWRRSATVAHPVTIAERQAGRFGEQQKRGQFA